MVKGPSSALWGSDALAGVINIITEKPGQEAFSASLSSRYGSHNTLDLSGQVSHQSGGWENQFFDKQGEAVHKMYLKKPDDVQLAAYHVLDPEFNLHLNQGGIAKCWLVEKPTEDGPVHSLELYDAEGATIASFFGARKPGIPQRKDWEQIIHEIRPLEAV